jgi:hypothetical protein
LTKEYKEKNYYEIDYGKKMDVGKCLFRKFNEELPPNKYEKFFFEGLERKKFLNPWAEEHNPYKTPGISEITKFMKNFFYEKRKNAIKKAMASWWLRRTG